MKRALAAVLLVLAPAWAEAQTTSPPAESYVTPTATERLAWIADATVGPRSLGVGVISSGWQTALNLPEEWGRSWRGLEKRYAEREADIAISSTIQAGLGSLWGEEVRYIPSHRAGVGPRIGYALKTVLLAQRPDGHLAPAWGRYSGKVLASVIENSWLPPSATTARGTVLRNLNGLLGRAIGNLWDEFWPDLKERIRRGPKATAGESQPPGDR